MAITYPLTPPPATALSVVYRPVATVAVSMSPFTYQTQVQAHAGHLLVFDVTLLPMTRAEADAWAAFFLALNGRLGTFLFGDPARRAPRGTGGGAPQVAGAGQTGQSLMTDGWAPSETVLRAGDWIQLGTTPATQRIYQVLTDVVSDASGGATLDLWPALRTSPADNEPLILTDTAGVFRLAENEMAYRVDRPLIFGFDFTAVEAL